jgi:spermidine synthase
MDTDSDNWLSEKISDNLVYRNRIQEVLFEGKTKYQSVRIVRCYSLGVCLVLDDKLQSCEKDEFIYHEAIVHPAMVAHPEPKSVFIAGGGEGGTLREVLRHNTVSKAMMVDIDDQVTELSRRYLPGESQGAFDDPRAEVHFTDARAYLENSPDRYDVSIIDLPDPIEEGPAYRLFTKEFYELVLNHLTDNGIISVQAGSTSLTELLNFTAVHRTLESVFVFVSGSTTNIPCLAVPWGFCFGSPTIDVGALHVGEVERRIAARSLTGLKFYDGITHEGMFNLPKYVRDSIVQQTRIITDDKPLFLYGR